MFNRFNKWFDSLEPNPRFGVFMAMTLVWWVPYALGDILKITWLSWCAAPGLLVMCAIALSRSGFLDLFKRKKQ